MVPSTKQLNVFDRHKIAKVYFRFRLPWIISIFIVSCRKSPTGRALEYTFLKVRARTFAVLLVKLPVLPSVKFHSFIWYSNLIRRVWSVWEAIRCCIVTNDCVHVAVIRHAAFQPVPSIVCLIEDAKDKVDDCTDSFYLDLCVQEGVKRLFLKLGVVAAPVDDIH